MLTGRGVCDELIQRSPTDCGASNNCDLENSGMRRPWLEYGRSAAGKRYSTLSKSRAL
jgi:hypothetical protein